MNSLFSEKKLLIYFEAWWLLVMLMQFWILRQSGLDNFHSLADLLYQLWCLDY